VGQSVFYEIDKELSEKVAITANKTAFINLYFKKVTAVLGDTRVDRSEVLNEG
jgi:hypothetical protein